MEHIYILGIRIDIIKSKEVLIKEIFRFYNKYIIFTPNPEIILKALKSEEYIKILNESNINIPDGIGIKLAFKIIKIGIFSNLDVSDIFIIPGVDIVKALFKYALENKKKVFILGSKTKNCENIKKLYFNKNPELFNFYSNIEFDDYGESINNEQVIKKINEFKPDILLVALGAPKQEFWIYKNRFKIVNFKLAIGIGGAIDILSGEFKRAPKIFRKLGLEWFFRLIQQPSRYKRIFKAVIIFPLEVIKWKFKIHFKFRKDAVCFLFKKQNNGFKVLIVCRRNDPNHWQLPQGGIEKQESTEKAIKREMKEEIGTDNFEIIKIVPNFYKYKWSFYYRLIMGYKGQNQNLVIAKFLGKDSDIKSTWEHPSNKWVDIKVLISKVHPIRRKMVKIALKEFYKVISKSYMFCFFIFFMIY